MTFNHEISEPNTLTSFIFLKAADAGVPPGVPFGPASPTDGRR
jgi:hypothetical protein